MKYAPLIAAVTATAMFAVNALAQMQGPPPPLPEAVLQAEQPDAAQVAWLRANTVITAPVDTALSIEVPKRLRDSQLVLLGEMHGSSAPQQLDLALARALHRHGFDRYVAEMDPLQAAMLDRYLVDGDAATLSRVFARWSQPDSQWGNQAFEAKLRALRAWSDDLDEDRRLRLVGIDAIQDWPLLHDWLRDHGVAADRIDTLTQDGDVAARARTALTALADVDDALVPALRTTLSLLAEGRDRGEVIFQSYAFQVRDGALARRKAFGLWGMTHVLQAGVNGMLPFAARVRASDLPAARALSSVLLLPLDSAVMLPVPLPTGVERMRLTDLNADGPIILVQGSRTLREAVPADTLAVFDLVGDGSPFASAPAFVATQATVGGHLVPDDAQRPATDYIQYIGAYRGSDWASPRTP